MKTFSKKMLSLANSNIHSIVTLKSFDSCEPYFGQSMNL